jgi:CheY-like chemotaxis protein
MEQSQPQHSPLQVVVADPYEDAAATLAEVLNFSGFVTHVALSAATALELVREFKAHALICAPRMRDMATAELVAAARATNPQIALIAITGWPRSSPEHQQEMSLFHEVLLKPVDPAYLVRSLALATRGAPANT